MASRGHAARMALQDQPRLDEFQVRAEPGNGPIDVTRHRDLTDAWLWRLGPASTLLYGELARLSLMPDPPCIDVAAMSRWLGVAPWTFWKAMDRLVIMDKGRIQQLGTPDEVYNDPANVFVAGFIGSTPMNLIKGNIENGAFVGPDVKVPKVGKGNRANVTIGIRPEDVSVVKTGSGHLNSKVYSIEPTGDQTLLAVDLAGKLVIARADRNFRQAIDTPVSLNFDPDRIYLFDTATGLRIRD